MNGNNITNKNGCYFCGPVRNCGPYLDKVIHNIEILGETVFNDNYKIVIFYDQSTDNTHDILKKYQHKLTNNKFVFYINNKRKSKYRTHNIAFARNQCLKYIYNEQKWNLFAMMDFDDVNAKPVHPHILQKYINTIYDNKWDSLSFNTSPNYYDIWGLSIYPYCFSYNHFKNSVQFYGIIQDYIKQKLNNIKRHCLEPNDLLQCISAFNGFAIYRMNAFRNCLYDGRTNPLLIPANMMNAHIKATHSGLIFPTYPVADCLYEDCEHRAFHVNAFLQNGAKIRIAPLCLFD